MKTILKWIQHCYREKIWILEKLKTIDNLVVLTDGDVLQEVISLCKVTDPTCTSTESSLETLIDALLPIVLHEFWEKFSVATFSRQEKIFLLRVRER